MLSKLYALVESSKRRYSIVQRSTEKAGARKSGWRPFYLQRRILAVFVFAFCAIFATLEVLNHFSNVKYGLASSSESLHYTWTYGPTLVLTIVAALWSRVDFQARQNAPWQQMRDGATEAEKSLLLDYVSMWQPAIVIKAVKNRHFSVAAGTICSMLLSLVIVFSTGLFSLQEVLVPHAEIPIQLANRFSGNNTDFDGLGIDPYDVLNAVTFENTSYPLGTTRELAYQQFSASKMSTNAVISATIDGMETELTCEHADLQINKWEVTVGSGISGLHAWKEETRDIDLLTPSCNITNIALVNEFDKTGYPDTSVVVTTRYVSRFTSATCNGTSGAGENRIIVTAVDVGLGNSTTKKVTQPEGTWDEVVTKLIPNRSVQLICEPKYSLIQLHATKNASDSSSVQLSRQGTSGSGLINITAWDLANAVVNALGIDDAGNKPIGSNNPFYANGTSNSGKTDIDYQTQLGAWMIGKTGSIDTLFEEGFLSNATSVYFRAMAAQYANRGLLVSEKSQIIGSASLNEDRVVMMELPLRVIEVCLAIGVLLIAAIILLCPRHVTTATPWNPNSISAIAATLSKSDDLRQRLTGTSGSSIPALQAHLSKWKFYSQTTPHGLRIDTSESDIDQVVDAPNDPTPFKPFPTFFFRILIFLVVVLMIIALEVCLHISQSNDGLGDVSTSKYMHYIWTVLPAILMETVSLSIGSMNSNARSIAMYRDLKRPTGAVFERFMLANFLDSTNLALVFESARLRHFAVMATTIAAFLTPFLTIATSGLYSIVDVPQHRVAPFTQETIFNYTYNGTDARYPELTTYDAEINSNQYNAEYIVTMNLSYPQWTFSEYAFPQISFEEPEDLRHEDFVDLVIPALRAAHPCHISTADQLNASYTPPVSSSSEALDSHGTVTVHVPSPTGSYDAGNISWSASGNSTSIATVWPVDDGIFGTKTRLSIPWVQAFIWGQVTNGSINQIAAMFCVSGIDTIDTRTRFTLPGFNISEDYPPVPIESSAKPAPNQGLEWLTWSDDFATLSAQIDSFFQAMVAGRYSIPVAYLKDPEKTQEVTKAIKFQDGILQAQGWNTISRIAANGTLDSDPLSGKVTSQDRLRLVQDSASTRFLQALLASILILGILGSLFLNTDCFLPKNPCSIAAVASFLADSNILDRYKTVGDPNSLSIGRDYFENCRFFFTQEDGSRLKSSDTPSEKLTPDGFTIFVVDPVDGTTPSRDKSTASSLPLMSS